MATRDIFSKHLPNVKLATKLDADGKEIQVERREDEEQNKKQQEIFDILVAAGYFRARIKGLSAFDKIVGGMTWCIDACDYDVDVDLLFHENLSIGQKIALTEKIVAVLPKMKCPSLIEPHQIQGLDFINIFPVIQWLVKRSVENRAEKAAKLKMFAISQFHNYFEMKTDLEIKEKNRNAVSNIKKIQEIYAPRRQYKRKDIGNEDEKTRVRITLLEYGDKGLLSTGKTITAKKSDEEVIIEEDAQAKEIDVDQLLKTLYVANEDDLASKVQLSDAEQKAVLKHYNDLKMEMSVDTKQLSEQSKIKALMATKIALEKKLQKIEVDNRELERKAEEGKRAIDEMDKEKKRIENEIKEFDSKEKKDEKGLVIKIQGLVLKNEELKQQETKYKEQCRQQLVKLQQDLKDSEEVSPDNDIQEAQELLEREKERLQALRLQVAKKNRAIVSIQRQLDNIPDRTELSQYQRRFLELYNQVSAKHRETKQFYALYNTLEDTKRYMEKELSILNSIYETYNDAMVNHNSKDQFIKQLDTIVEGVRQTKVKVRNKRDDEKAKRDGLNAQFMCLVELQRKYAGAVKQITKECQRNKTLQLQLNSMHK